MLTRKSTDSGGSARQRVRRLAGINLSTMDAVVLNGDETSPPPIPAAGGDSPAATAEPPSVASGAPSVATESPPVFRSRVVPFRFVRVDGHGEALSPAAFRALVEAEAGRFVVVHWGWF